MLVRTIKTWWLIAAFLSGFTLAMGAEELLLNWRDNRLHFSAPLHFLAGHALERLHNGADVPFDYQITLWSGTRTHVFRKMAERFVVSWDVWEEKFKVVKTQPPRKAAAHMDSLAAEAWCRDQMMFDVNGLGEKEIFWARVEIREEDRSLARNAGDSSVSLKTLIELFSRPPTLAQSHWEFEYPALTLEDLKRGHR
jgi:hypothetical protein